MLRRTALKRGTIPLKRSRLKPKLVFAPTTRPKWAKLSAAALITDDDAEKLTAYCESGDAMRPVTPRPRKRRDYGGPVSQELGGSYPAFRKRIFERDGACLLCESPTCLPLTLAHLGDKVGMGGRRTSTVNTLENACALGLRCHQLQEESKTLTTALLRKMQRRYGYGGNDA